MRITYLELAGHKKIKNGTGKYRIHFDAQPGINLIQGPNGVGKSTILNELTPFPSQSSNWYGEAFKCVRFILDGEEYDVSYYWKDGKPVEAYFIKLNQTEPGYNMSTKNTFGAVTEALSMKLGLDANFEALTCLSSYDNKSFALLRPAERKRFLNTIVQNLDVYNNIYKTLSKRSSIFKAMVGTLTAKISNLGGNPLDFGEHIRTHQGVIDSLVAEKDQLTKQILSYDMSPEEVKEYNDAVKSKGILFKEFTIINQKIKDEFTNYLNNFHMNITEFQAANMLASKENDLKELINNRSRFQARLLENGNAIVSCRKNVYEFSTLLNNALASADYKAYTTSISETFKQELLEARKCAESIHTRYTTEFINDSSNFIRLVCDNETFFRFKELFVKKLRETIAVTSSFPHLKKFLKNEFKDFCNKFVSADGHHFQVSSIIEHKHQVYQFIKDRVATVDGKTPVEILDQLDLTILNYQDYVRIEQINQELLQYLDTFHVPKTWRKLFNKIIEDQDTKMGDVDKLYDEFSDYNRACDIIRQYEESLTSIKAGEDLSEQIRNYREFIDQNQSQIRELESDNLVVRNNLDELELDIQLCNRQISALKALDDYIKRVNDIRDKLDLLDQIIKPIPDLAPLQDRVEQINNQLKAENDIIYKLRYSSDLFQEYTHELTQIENNYSRLETLKKYCSPTSGIQIIFIDLYINKILEMANQLLGMFFNGEFVIQPFKITDKEFQIPVKGNGLLIDDISSLSASQMTIVNMCISFAIMMHSSSKLNILRLDEMDAPLDDVNSYIFPELVTSAMASLNCEQAFIITHSVMSQNTSNYNKIQVDKL